LSVAQQNNTFKWLFALFLLCCCLGCIEEFDAKTEIFESLLIIDALLTDEEKRHRVQLSRVFTFEEDTPRPVTGAVVEVVYDKGVVFGFEERTPGTYLSEIESSTANSEGYILTIVAADGKRYVSDNVTTPEKKPIAQLIAKRYTNDLGVEGVGMLLDNTEGGNESTFFRFKYEEMFKIIAPRWDPFELKVVHYTSCDTIPYKVAINTRTEERKVCYGSAVLRRMIQASSGDLTNSDIKNKEIRFVLKDDYIMSHRYSLMVRQYAKTREAYSYYERLADFSFSELVFSQVQPGFFEGNIFSDSSSSERILGFFEVASVSEEGIFFNYEDLSPNEPLPPYAINYNAMGNPQLYRRGYHCDGFRVCDGACESPLIEAILAGLITFAAENEENTNQPYFSWPSPCGDCRKLGSNIVPKFWIEG
jgi:hypothetical protein